MTQAPDGLPVPARLRAVVVIILGIALSALDGTVLTFALPGIARDLRVSAASSVWVVNSYQLAALGMLLPCAALGDRFGYRRVYLAGAAIFTIASALCLSANSLPTLAAARGLQGVGAAGLMAVNGALLRLIYPRHLFGRGLAVNSGMVASASVAGPSIAAAILSVASWPWLFAPNLVLGPLVLVLGWFALPHNAAAARPGARLALADVVLNVLMFGLVFLGAQALGAHGGSAPGRGSLSLAVALLVAGALVGTVHLRRQWNQSAPLFPADLLRLPVFALSMCTSVGAFSAQTLAFIALPFLLLEAWGRSAAEAGLLMTVWPLAVVCVVPVAGRLIGRHPGGLLGAIGLAALACGLALLAALPAAPSTDAIAWRMAVCGAGFGLFQSPNNHTILTSAPVNRSGAAGGMLGTARLTGQTLGAVLLVFVFSLAGGHAGPGSTLALALAAGLAALAGVFSSLRMPRFAGPP